MSSTNETAETVSFDLVVQDFSLGKLTTNAEAIRDAVKLKLESYKVENYSGDKIQDAKRDKAELNAAATRLNAARLEYERTWMKPFDVFKSVVDETVKLIKTASAAIDQVVKDVEQGEKDEKRRQIEAFWISLACDLFRLEQIFDERWTNKTTKMADIKDKIKARIAKVDGDLAILEKIGEPEARAHYLTVLDLNSAIAKADELKQNRERLAAAEKARIEAEERRRAAEAERARLRVEADERARKADEERRAREDAARAEKAKAMADEVIEAEGLAVAEETEAEEADRVIAEQAAAEPEPVPVVIPEPALAVAPPEPVLEYRLVLRGTRHALVGLCAYMDEHGIEHQKIA